MIGVMIDTSPNTSTELARAIQERDARFDGVLFYGVTSTGIYCRPSCPSRRPSPRNIRFFLSTRDAEAAGYRACLRCHPSHMTPDPALTPVLQALTLMAGSEELPTSDRLAEALGQSPEGFRKLFHRKLGLSPKAVAEALKAERLRSHLQAGEPVSQAIYGAGYGSSSRVYERAGRVLGMTPASYARGGAGATIAYASASTPFGLILVAATEKGLCHVGLGDDEPSLVAELTSDFPKAAIFHDRKMMQASLQRLVDHLNGKPADLNLPLDVRATAFQWRVWQALVDIPAGETRTYGAMAQALNHPKAARAVGRACATNPISILVPCHRAVGADGSLTGYRWGVARKRKLLAAERQEQNYQEGPG